MKILTVKEMREIEQEANTHEITNELMMKRAGLGIARIVTERYGHLNAHTVLGLIGPGNNGGDTLLALATLAQSGWQAIAYLSIPRPTGDPLVAHLEEMKVTVISASEDGNHEDLVKSIQQSTVLLDGILGTGTHLPLKPEITKILTVVSHQGNLPHIVAVDCPSGVDCSTGEAAEETLPAELTICLEAVKSGLLQFPAFDYVGNITTVDLGLPKKMDAWPKVDHQMVSAEMVRKLLPKRPHNAHKGTFGTATIVAGSVNFTGAAYLAAMGAYRVGAGLVRLAVPTPIHPILSSMLPEATWLLLPHNQGVISEDAAQLLIENLEKVDALLLGPGWGLDESTQNFLNQLLAANDHHAAKSAMGFLPKAISSSSQKITLPPMVIDADGLKLLARLPKWHELLPEKTILTPHPGEMGVLTGLKIEEIQANRVETARNFAVRWGKIVVLKGAMTVVADPSGKTRTIPIATSALAKAGTGDVLSGVIVGLLAQKVAPFEAAVAGAWLHGQAGVVAARQVGVEASVLASDVANSLAQVLKYLA